ncbi:MAG: hypothetical protein ACJAS1_005984 [Oleiphilaceae bacterium]|jgi:hypothetical protein
MKTPDIEIYVKDCDIKIIATWLEKNFSTVNLPNNVEKIFAKGNTIRAEVGNDNATTDLIISPKAAGKSFCSIWFKQNMTKWENDESCAQSLLNDADMEIRCSASGWTEEEEEQSEQWLLLTREERKLINWG